MFARTVPLLAVMSIACFPVSYGWANKIDKLAEQLAPLADTWASAKKENNEVVDGLYLATIVRLPTAAEKERLEAFLKKAPTREQGCRDILFALVNSREFLELHGLSIADSLELTRKMGVIWMKKQKK